MQMVRVFEFQPPMGLMNVSGQGERPPGDESVKGGGKVDHLDGLTA